jgi:hypothetical protein
VSGVKVATRLAHPLRPGRFVNDALPSGSLQVSRGNRPYCAAARLRRVYTLAK